MTTTTNPKDRIGVTKVPLGLLPLSFQTQTALALFDGSLKYGRWNWQTESVAASVYVDAALRHILKWYHGEEVDADSGAHPLGHAAACLAILLDARSRENLVDDRPMTNESPRELDESREIVLDILNRRSGPQLPAPNFIKHGYENVPEYATDPESERQGLENVINSFDNLFGDDVVSDCAQPIANQAINCFPGPICHDTPQHHRDSRIIKVEEILGHDVRFMRDDFGYIDGEMLNGTNFTSRVARYRRGYQTWDEECQAIHEQEDLRKEYEANRK